MVLGEGACTSSIHELRFGSEVIPFEVGFGEVSKLSISVHPDRRVTVVAPNGVGLAELLPKVQRRASWIAKQRSYFEKFQPLPTPRRFVSGETHLYLGRQYRLKVKESTQCNVVLRGKFIHVDAQDRRNSGELEAALNQWYWSKAETVFEARLSKCLTASPLSDLVPPRMLVRRMIRRWGSCSRAGTILLNVELVKAPVPCIDYVVTHELCHLRVHNHGLPFYRLLSRCMPDWETRKERLSRFVL